MKEISPYYAYHLIGRPIEHDDTTSVVLYEGTRFYYKGRLMEVLPWTTLDELFDSDAIEMGCNVKIVCWEVEGERPNVKPIIREMKMKAILGKTKTK